MAQFFMLLTQAGDRKLAAHMAGGAPLQITQMAFGDGGGAEVLPTESRTALVQEVHRQGLTNLSVDDANPSWVIAESVLATTVGGWWIREIGLYDIAGELVAYGNCAPSYKPTLAEGSAGELVFRPRLQVSSTAAITLIVDSSMTWATQAWVLGKNYATQAWVAAQGYATQTWVLQQFKRHRARRFHFAQINL